MEKRNTLLLTVVAVATLLVSVVGATFAYFTSLTAGEGVSTTLDVEAQASTARFTATGAELGFVVTGADMLRGNVAVEGSETETIAKSDNDTLSVDLTATTVAKCSYDIVFTWDEGSSYTPTTGLGEDQIEFGVKMELTTDTNATAGTNNVSNEINFDDVAALEADPDGGYILVKGAELTVNGEDEAHAVWTITATMYNLNLDQSKLATGPEGTAESTSYNGKFTVANVVC